MECATCPITKWAYWTPYEVIGKTDIVYELEYATRAPGPFKTGFTSFSLQCVDECPEFSEYDDEVQVFEELRTCWVEVDQKDLMDTKFLDGMDLVLSTTNDILSMMSWISNSITNGYTDSSGIQVSTEDLEDIVYLRKKSQEDEKTLEYITQECVPPPYLS
jgi:hypothetical protein